MGGMWACTSWRKQRGEGDGCLRCSMQQPDLETWMDFNGISLSEKSRRHVKFNMCVKQNNCTYNSNNYLVKVYAIKKNAHKT